MTLQLKIFLRVSWKVIFLVYNIKTFWSFYLLLQSH